MRKKRELASFQLASVTFISRSAFATGFFGRFLEPEANAFRLIIALRFWHFWWKSGAVQLRRSREKLPMQRANKGGWHLLDVLDVFEMTVMLS
jgi:hypothetical protein